MFHKKASHYFCSSLFCEIKSRNFVLEFLIIFIPIQSFPAVLMLYHKPHDSRREFPK